MHCCHIFLKHFFLQNDIHNRGWYRWFSYNGTSRKTCKWNTQFDRHHKDTTVRFPMGLCSPLSLCRKRNKLWKLRGSANCSGSNWTSKILFLNLQERKKSMYETIQFIEIFANVWEIYICLQNYSEVNAYILHYILYSVFSSKYNELTLPNPLLRQFPLFTQNERISVRLHRW